MDEWYTANLVNGLGNVVARIMKLAETHLPEAIGKPEVAEFSKEYIDALSAYNFMAAMDYVWNRIQKLDEKLTAEAPFKVVKDDLEKGRAIISECVAELYTIARLLYPFLPNANEVIKAAVLANKKPENLFPRLVN
jgi:methionyl-tRNA synthetase